MKPHSVRPSWLFSACVLWTHEVALAVPFGNAIFRQRLDHAQKLQEKLNPPGIHVEDPSKIQTFCKQRLDHFDHSNGKLWCQRFVADATYFQAKGPVFLCLDGEDRPWGRGGKAHTLTCNNMVELAPRFGALLVALEHRYYGGMDFDGVPDFSTPNLRYLSSRQALADANAFKSFLEAKLRLEGSPWVAFGGSYSGALAAWVRQLYPEAFAAAVASSAPVEAQLNFQGYFNVVASTLTASSVGGSPACLATILNGHQEAARRLGSSEGRRFLEQQFHLCGKNPLEVRKNVAGWAGMGLVTTTQYNSNRCSSTSCNVGLLCSTLARLRAETSSDLEAVIRLHHLQEAEVGATECADVSWDAWLDTLKLTEKVNTSSPLADSQFYRIWEYQVCTEWGNFMTCQEGSNCPWTKGFNDLGFWLDMCETLFGIPPDEVRKNIERTNQFYGGKDFPNGSRVVFTNGEVDPWHALSLLVSPRPDIDTIYVEGASHCEWMQEWKGMPQQIRNAKQAIQNKVGQWLEQLTKLKRSARKFLAASSALQLGLEETSHLQLAKVEWEL